MKQVLLGILATIAGVSMFAGLLWLAIFIINFKDSTTNLALYFLINSAVWIVGFVILGTVIYILHLVYNQYTDSDISMAEIRKRKAQRNPEFE